MEAMALIEIDGLPINSMVIFHGKLWMSQPDGTRAFSTKLRSTLDGGIQGR